MASFRELTHEQQRLDLRRRAQAGLWEIRQIRIDCESWNDNARTPDDAPMNPDPAGDLARLELYYEMVLKSTDSGVERATARA